MHGKRESDSSGRGSAVRRPPNATCVEVVAAGSDTVTVRDATDPAGPALVFTAAEWDAFLRGVRAGEFDLDDRRS